mmetsp:Transcript_123888/g.358302  ORF Transcript_123888/g.358302 Transcript_123888/m.358302 type:complete len:247 (+) Transcript_123888:79-819(+)
MKGQVSVAAGLSPLLLLFADLVKRLVLFLLLFRLVLLRQRVGQALHLRRKAPESLHPPLPLLLVLHAEVRPHERRCAGLRRSSSRNGVEVRLRRPRAGGGVVGCSRKAARVEVQTVQPLLRLRRRRRRRGRWHRRTLHCPRLLLFHDAGAGAVCGSQADHPADSTPQLARRRNDLAPAFVPPRRSPPEHTAEPDDVILCLGGGGNFGDGVGEAVARGRPDLPTIRHLLRPSSWNMLQAACRPLRGQ